MNTASVARQLMLLGVTAVLAFASVVAQQRPPASANPSQKVEDVRVIGCLKHEGSDWLLTSATDPVPNKPPTVPEATAPPVKVPPPPPGRNQFKLIGVDVFHLPTRQDQRVEVTGLLITAKPVNRINITTVVPVAPTCDTSGP